MLLILINFSFAQTHLTAHLDARLAPLVSAISLLANGFEGLKQHIQAFHHNLEGGPDSQQTTINDGGDVHWF
jgi:hypothetical protein